MATVNLTAAMAIVSVMIAGMVRSVPNEVTTAKGANLFQRIFVTSFIYICNAPFMLNRVLNPRVKQVLNASSK